MLIISLCKKGKPIREKKKRAEDILKLEEMWTEPVLARSFIEYLNDFGSILFVASVFFFIKWRW